ncbi:hypothetical protein DL96DRAFT_1626869 [Flagelloscypha sp. PMI_526]|nr:hypothetical protein DL96DRAFT_1626869 [Flagelloscypha sp. PMI_526]
MLSEHLIEMNEKPVESVRTSETLPSGVLDLVGRLKEAATARDIQTATLTTRHLGKMLAQLGIRTIEDINLMLDPAARLEWSGYRPDSSPAAIALFIQKEATIVHLDATQDFRLLSSRDLTDALSQKSVPSQAEIAAMTAPVAETFLLLLQFTLHAQIWDKSRRKTLLRLIQHTSFCHNILPPSFICEGITVANDVYRGSLSDGRAVCLKVLRIFMDSERGDLEEESKRKAFKSFLREAFLRHQVDHPNILPLLGVSHDSFPHRLAFVSPLMTNGDVMVFLRNELQPYKVRLDWVPVGNCAWDSIPS